MSNTSRDLFFDDKDTLARRASRVLFILPLLASGLLLGAITIWRENPVPAVIGALAVIAVSVVGGALIERVSTRAFRERLRSAESSKRAKHQIEELFAMTDMLQAAEDHEDAGSILMATAQRLLPEFSGALYVFNNSRDRLDLAKS